MYRSTSTDPSGDEPGANLPLVLVTVGDDDRELEVLTEFLESAAQEVKPSFQGLIVATTDMSEMMYRVLRGRIGSLDHIHLRRLGDTETETRLHETGTFLVSKLRKEEED